MWGNDDRIDGPIGHPLDARRARLAGHGIREHVEEPVWGQLLRDQVRERMAARVGNLNRASFIGFRCIVLHGGSLVVVERYDHRAACAVEDS